MRLLLVEDDTMIGRAVRQSLGDAGFTVDWVTDGRAAVPAMPCPCCCTAGWRWTGRA